MRKSFLIVGATASIAALGVTLAILRSANPEGIPYHQPTASTEDLTAVTESRVLFAHQSVGRNIIGGIPAVYEAHHLPTPEFTQLSQAGPEDNLLHLTIGENGQPLGKVEAFDELIRSGLGESLEAAILKFCYEDVREGTDVRMVFTEYRDMLAALQRDYPNIRFVAATVPLTTMRGPLDTVKAMLGRGNKFGPTDNVAREKFNALLRAEYAGTDYLLDVAALESTTPDGDRVADSHDGELYYALNESYAADPGHLNARGAARVAEGLLAVVGSAVQD